MAWAGAPFIVALIPDTQNYRDYWMYRAGSDSYQHFFNLTAWLADHAADQNIRFVSPVGDGVQIQGVEAMVATDAVLSAVKPLTNWEGAYWAHADVTAAVQAWLAGEANYGWLLLGGEGVSTWEFSSSEGPLPPELVVCWHHVPEPGTAVLAGAASLASPGVLEGATIRDRLLDQGG